MSIEAFVNIGIVCTALIALIGLLVLLMKGLHGVWRRDQRLTDLLGLVEAVSQKLTAMTARQDLTNERLDATNARLDAVEMALAWHNPAAPGPVLAKPNSGNPRRPRP